MAEAQLRAGLGALQIHTEPALMETRLRVAAMPQAARLVDTRTNGKPLTFTGETMRTTHLPTRTLFFRLCGSRPSTGSYGCRLKTVIFILTGHVSRAVITARCASPCTSPSHSFLVVPFTWRFPLRSAPWSCGWPL